MSVQAPYYAVIFSSKHSSETDGYEQMATRMVELAKAQPGFLGIESARGEDGRGITVSYWESLKAIQDWKEHGFHRTAQSLGKSKWYETFQVRICRVEREYGSDTRNGVDP